MDFFPLSSSNPRSTLIVNLKIEQIEVISQLFAHQILCNLTFFVPLSSGVIKLKVFFSVHVALMQKPANLTSFQEFEYLCHIITLLFDISLKPPLLCDIFLFSLNFGMKRITFMCIHNVPHFHNVQLYNFILYCYVSSQQRYSFDLFSLLFMNLPKYGH